MEGSQVKGQISLEYVLVVALTFAIIVPTTYLFYNYSRDSTTDIIDAQITKIGRGIIDSSEVIFYSGAGSRTTLELNIPEGVKAAYIIDGRELVFNVTTSAGNSEIVFFSAINITTTGSDCIANVCSVQGLAEKGFRRIRLDAINKNSISIVSI
jgi:uncharacterized protein (UPF0333 family)